jgi:hypothetical protein
MVYWEDGNLTLARSVPYFSNRQIGQFIATCNSGFLNFLISLVAAIGGGEIAVEESIELRFLKQKRLFKALKAKKTAKRAKRELFQSNPLAVRLLLEAALASQPTRDSRKEISPEPECSPSDVPLSASTPTSSAPPAPPSSASRASSSSTSAPQNEVTTIPTGLNRPPSNLVKAELDTVPEESEGAEVGEVEVDEELEEVDESEEVDRPPRDLLNTLLAEVGLTLDDLRELEKTETH